MERFRDATGKDVGALEAEKAARGALESRSRTQVRGRQKAVLPGRGLRGRPGVPLAARWPPASSVQGMLALQGAVCSCLVQPRCRLSQQVRWRSAGAPPALPLQAELNSNLHEQVLLLREQKELSEARAEKSAAEVKKLTAKVRGAPVRIGGSLVEVCR